MAEELLKTEFDAARVIYNRFKSAIAYKPTIATVLSPDVSTRPGDFDTGAFCVPVCLLRALRIAGSPRQCMGLS